jgi:hypothetical protein
MEACRRGFAVRYTRFSELPEELNISQQCGLKRENIRNRIIVDKKFHNSRSKQAGFFFELHPQS